MYYYINTPLKIGQTRGVDNRMSLFFETGFIAALAVVQPMSNARDRCGGQSGLFGNRPIRRTGMYQLRRVPPRA